MHSKFSPLDLLDLPSLERENVLWIARNGPFPIVEIARTTGNDSNDMRLVVEQLVKVERHQNLDGGNVEVALGRFEGKVKVFAGAPGTVAQSFQWILETAIERTFRVAERGMCFNVPHASAYWTDDGASRSWQSPAGVRKTRSQFGCSTPSISVRPRKEMSTRFAFEFLLRSHRSSSRHTLMRAMKGDSPMQIVNGSILDRRDACVV